MKPDNKDSYTKTIALAGNPNVGKSTLFNKLSGLKQHTGNWSGKTVDIASAKIKLNNEYINIIDLPGTYSLLSASTEENIARNYICFGGAELTIIVLDGTQLERNLFLALQILEMTDKIIICINLQDEMNKKGIIIDEKKLSELLKTDIYVTSANKRNSIKNLINKSFEHFDNFSPVYKIKYSDEIEGLVSLMHNDIDSRWICLKVIDGDKDLLSEIKENYKYDNTLIKNIEYWKKNIKIIMEEKNIDSDIIRENIYASIINQSEKFASDVTTIKNENFNSCNEKLDSIITSKKFGIPIMLLFLALIFYITIVFSNYPSLWLTELFNFIESYLTDFFNILNAPVWLHNLLITGVFRTLGWVISVMLPPMTIFFPLFALLEDAGFLPRIAFNLDKYFKKAGTCGKQALTMCMGFGCNAVGVTGCRIIESKRERLIAAITNSFVPCNGRFPILITISSIFICSLSIGSFSSVISSLSVLIIVFFSIIMTLFISKILSKTLLKGQSSTFVMELPSYRKPQFLKVIISSFVSKTLHILGRAVIVAAPAGLVIWSLANIYIDNLSLLNICANFFDPAAKLFGLDGHILFAFLLGIPANEIVIPILIMSYMSKNSLSPVSGLNELKNIFITNGWTLLTGINVMLLTVFHFPCATTLLIIKKETGSLKWTIVSFFLPLVIGLALCFIITQTVNIINLVI